MDSKLDQGGIKNRGRDLIWEKVLQIEVGITNLMKDYNLVHNNDCALLSVLKFSSTKDIDLKCF